MFNPGSGYSHKVGRPTPYIYPQIEAGETLDLHRADVCVDVVKGTLRGARKAILGMAKRKGHVLFTEITGVIDYECVNNRREVLRITRIK